MRIQLVLFVILWLPQATGCASLGRRGPPPAEVAAAREMSMQGMAAVEGGQWDRAESLLRKSLETSPSDADSRRYLAEALWRRGATDQALTQIVAAAQLDGGDASLAVRAGEMLLAAGSAELALAQANQAIQLDSRLAAAWALRGRTYWHLHQPDRALADLHHALECQPNNRDVLLDVAGIYRQLGQPTRCLTTLHHLLDTYSPGEEPQQVLLMEGLALNDLGRGRQAADSLWAACRRGPPSAEILCLLAQVQTSIGEYDTAAASAQQALALDATHAASRALLAELAGRTTAIEPHRR
ncbi:MAG: tetratricopeptide repeat protein [Pirellulales bacterium]